MIGSGPAGSRSREEGAARVGSTDRCVAGETSRGRAGDHAAVPRVLRPGDPRLLVQSRRVVPGHRRGAAGEEHRAATPAVRRGVPGRVARRPPLRRGQDRNSRTLLRRNERSPNDEVFAQLKPLAERALVASSLESLLGVEGTAARLYFSRFSTMLRRDFGFDFEGRNRRPPRDPVNCLLSFLYALLVKNLTAVVFTIGFDPYLGMFHKPRFGRPALALDLAEEFRPLIADSVAVNVINNGEVKPADFLVRAGGVGLTPDGRRSVVAAYERRLDTEVTHPVFGYRVAYRRVLEVQARLLAAYLMREIPDYVPFTTR